MTLSSLELMAWLDRIRYGISMDILQLFFLGGLFIGRTNPLPDP